MLSVGAADEAAAANAVRTAGRRRPSCPPAGARRTIGGRWRKALSLLLGHRADDEAPALDLALDVQELQLAPFLVPFTLRLHAVAFRRIVVRSEPAPTV